MGGLLILISMVAGTVAFISLIRPLPRLWLPTRKRAALVWIASFVLLLTGGSLLPDPTPPQSLDIVPVGQEPLEAQEEQEWVPPLGNNIQQKPCIPMELSPAAVELVRLYEELHTFKDDPKFLRMGFALGGPYAAWLQAIERHGDENPGFELLDELGFSSNDVMMLGMNYMDEDFSESDLSAIEYFERKIQAGLASARCNEPGSEEWKEIVQAASEARNSYAAETKVQIVARESLLGRPLTDEELALERLRDTLEAGDEYPVQRAERAAVAELRPLVNRMREIGEQRKQEYEAALARFSEAGATADVFEPGTWAAALAAGEAVLDLATVIAAEMSALATELAELEATAPPEVATLAATNRMVMEQALASYESAAAGLHPELEKIRAMVAELSIDEHSTPRSRVSLEMMGDARMAIKDSDDSIVEVGLGGQGGIGNRQRTIFLEVLRGTSILHAKELGENAVRIVERLWSDMEAADYTIVVSRTGPPVRSSRESDERIIVKGSKGKF